MSMKYFESNASRPRFETHDGKEYLVVPVIMARAGVEMNGGVIQLDELHAESWNGVPVTVTHPKDASGNDISANSPDVLDRYRVGTIFNATIEDGALKAEAWVDPAKAGQELTDRLKAMEAMDVSTGYFAPLVNGEYTDIKPDHLALLPNERGACSFDDGCGVRSNKVQEFFTQMKKFFTADNKISETLRLRLNEKGYREIMDNLQAKLNEMDRPDAFYYLIDVFEDDFIYKVEGEGDSVYYRRGYEMSDNGISMSGDAQRVQKEINYQPVTNRGATMIDQLISNEAAPFTEDDREFLKNKDEKTIQAFADTYLKEPETNDGEEKGKTPSAKSESVLSNDDKEALEIARQARKEKREEYITHITANSSMCKDKLEAMDTNTLKDIAAGIKPVADYSGRSFGVKTNTDEEIVKAMTPPSTKELIQNKRKQVN